jgi:predicted dehydrogenase
MSQHLLASTVHSSRRAFLRQSGGALAGAALTSAFPLGIHAAETHTIKIALVGCGGRGTGAAANALSTRGPTKLWAVADAFQDRLESSLKQLTGRFAAQVDVPPERRYAGLDGFRRAIDSLDRGDVVLLATPPAFRPIHFEYAVNKGVHVFMEKSFAVDAPGIRRVLRVAQLAREKNVKVACGLMWRHDPPREEVIQRIHDGAIGDLVTLRTYRMHDAVGISPKPPGVSELSHQIRHYNNFTWLNAGFFVDWLIHNIDVCCWAKNAWPISAQGMGGRSVRTEPDQMFDHYMVEYTFADGAKLFAQARHINRCYGLFSDVVHGTRGSAVIMQDLAAAKPRIYKNQHQVRAQEVWRYQGPEPDAYQVEHDLFFKGIREDLPYNEAERGATACMVAILGRMAVYSGQLLTYAQALASTVELAPGLDHLTWDSPAPAQPNAQGQYELPKPGTTNVL